MIKAIIAIGLFIVALVMLVKAIIKIIQLKKLSKKISLTNKLKLMVELNDRYPIVLKKNLKYNTVLKRFYILILLFVGVLMGGLYALSAYHDDTLEVFSALVLFIMTIVLYVSFKKSNSSMRELYQNYFHDSSAELTELSTDIMRINQLQRSFGLYHMIAVLLLEIDLIFCSSVFYSFLK